VPRLKEELEVHVHVVVVVGVVDQLLDQVEQITKEQNYQRYREERFRHTSESTNSRVLWWSLAQTVVLVCMGFWQMRHLKSFFEAKKLV